MASTSVRAARAGPSVRPTPDAAAPSRSAFSYPDFRRYWLASVAFALGVQFRFIAGGWLVYELTDSPFWLGVPGIVSAVFTIALTVPAGALADRFDSARVLAWGRGLSGLLHLALALAVVSDRVSLPIVIAWAAATGVLAAVTNPSQQALLARVIHRNAMPNAVAMGTAVWNAMRIVGPAAAGLVIASLGVGQAFLVTAAGSALSAGLVASLKLAAVDHSSRSGQDDGALAGVRYILANRLFLATIGLAFFSAVFGRSYSVLLPVFADEILNVGVTGFGWLEAAAGVGALIGTLGISRVELGRHTGAAMVGASIGFGLCVGAFAGSRSMALSMGLLFLGGVSSSVYLNLALTTLQLLVPDHLRGRVMGVWGLTWFLAPAGGFVAGSLAAWLGADIAVAVCALSTSGFAALVYLGFAEVRRIPARHEMSA